MGSIYFLDLFIFFFFLHYFFFFSFSNLFFLFKKFVSEVSIVFGFEKSLVMSSFFSFFLFVFLLGCCFGGYFCYSICLCGMFEFTLFLALSSWFCTFLLFISSEKFSVYMSKEGDVFLKSLVMLLIEFVSEVSRPIALTVRLTVNILVGHMVSVVFYSGFELVFGNFFFFFILFGIFMECFVFFIQSYIFSRLVFLYLNE